MKEKYKKIKIKIKILPKERIQENIKEFQTQFQVLVGP